MNVRNVKMATSGGRATQDFAEEVVAKGNILVEVIRRQPQRTQETEIRIYQTGARQFPKKTFQTVNGPLTIMNVRNVKMATSGGRATKNFAMGKAAKENISISFY